MKKSNENEKMTKWLNAVRVSPNLDKRQSGCDYCLNHKLIEPIDDGYDATKVYVDKSEKRLIINDYEDIEHYFDITYCPMCGGKLVKE